MVRPSIPLIVAILVVAPAIDATPLEQRLALDAAAMELLAGQEPDGSFAAAGDDLDVHGSLALALLETFRATGDPRYLGDETRGLTAARDHLVRSIDADAEVTLTAPGISFLATFGLLTGQRADLELARIHLERATAAHPTPDAFVDDLVADMGAPGLWTAASWVRAAHDSGAIGHAHAMADALAQQTRVDVFDPTTDLHELGLSGIGMGLAESDVLVHLDLVSRARDTLLGRQCANGAFPLTEDGRWMCTSVIGTSRAVLALAYSGGYAGMPQACDLLAATQDASRWTEAGTDPLVTTAAAMTALAHCLAPAQNGATAYADAATQLV